MNDVRTHGSVVTRVGIVIGQLSHGGAEKQVVVLTEGLLQSEKYIPVVFCLSNHVVPYGKYLTNAGVEWYQVPENTRPGLGKLFWLFNKLRIYGCSIIYGILHIGNIYGGAAAILLRLPFVASIRNVDPQLPIHIRIMSSFICKRAPIVIANSSSCVKSLERDMGVRHGRFEVIHNAVILANPDPGSREKIRNKLGIPQEALVVGTVANLKAQKRFDFFLDVFLYCHKLISVSKNKVNTPLHFVWIGDGPEWDNLRMQLSRLPNNLKSALHFPGARDDVTDCLSAFDLFILTSAYEGMPNALLEAMAAGLPCVATEVQGTTDIFFDNPDVGILGPTDDPKKFAVLVSALLKDKDCREILGSTAKEHVRNNYSVEQLVGRMEDLFSQIDKKRSL